jgi:peptide chain release factor 3
VLAFIEQHRGDIARDLDGDAVYLAANTFSLNYEADRAPSIIFKTLKDYQVRKAA